MVTAAKGVPRLAPPARALLLGVVAGLRSQVPVALLAIEASQGRFDPGAGRLGGWLESRGGVRGVSLAALAEMVADKLPFIPSRLRTGPLLGRVATGAVVGAAVSRDAGRPVAAGALLGAAGAGAGSVVGARARAAAARRTRLPDPLVAVLEDLVAVGLGVAVVAAGRRDR